MLLKNIKRYPRAPKIILSARVSISGNTRIGAVSATRFGVVSSILNASVKNALGSKIVTSASRNTRYSPDAILAQRFLPIPIVWRFSPVYIMILSVYFLAISIVASVLPPSDIMISFSHLYPESHKSVFSITEASRRVGIINEIIHPGVYV